ncbi:unnamed protein product [Cochlearia groenlandica]
MLSLRKCLGEELNALIPCWKVENRGEIVKLSREYEDYEYVFKRICEENRRDYIGKRIQEESRSKVADLDKLLVKEACGVKTKHVWSKRRAGWSVHELAPAHLIHK